MEVKLVVVGGKHAGREVAVPGPKFFIGRAEDCHLRPGSDLVSRRHAVILVEEGFVAVCDFGSSNGTFVNGRRIEAEHELKNGDRLRIGPLEFDVELGVSVGGKRRPKVHSIEEAAVRTVETGHNDELDIFNLLGEEEVDAADAQVADTRSLSTTPTAKTDTHDPAKAPEQTPKKPKKKGKQSGIVGRFQTGRQPIAESSRSAASEMLKRLMKRKP